MTIRHATSARSNNRSDPRAIVGRTSSVRTRVPAMRGMVVQSSRPANAKSVQAVRATSNRAWALDRCARVVVLVLVPVVPRIVVLVAGEIDFVEHDRDRSGIGPQEGFEGALRETPSGHLGADHVHDSADR